MPIHFIWGDATSSTERHVNRLIKKFIDPAWASLNLSRLDGGEHSQAAQALQEARTPPFGTGARFIILTKSPFCNNCPKELSDGFEQTLELIPGNSHLILINKIKPDGRLKTTKLIQKLIKQKTASEMKFSLPPVWDNIGQCNLVERIVSEFGLKIDQEATSYLVEAIGNDSMRLVSEIEKIAIFNNKNSKN